MTLTTALSAPLFVVVGATGNRGRSVIRHLSLSTKTYRVRGIVREVFKPAAVEVKGQFPELELVAADVTDADKAREAFKGGDLAFCMIIGEPQAEHPEDTHFEKGKIQVDAAVASGVTNLAWSGSIHVHNLSGGRFSTKLFEGEARVTDYARSISGLKVHDVRAPSFATNYLTRFPPRKQPDGIFTLTLPYHPDTKVPCSDILHDFGGYVVAAVEKDVGTVYAAPSYISSKEIVEAFSAVSGRDVFYQQVDRSTWHETLRSRVGEPAATHAMEMFIHFEDFGYYGGENKMVDLAESNYILTTPARSFYDFLVDNKKVIEQLFA